MIQTWGDAMCLLLAYIELSNKVAASMRLICVNVFAKHNLIKLILIEKRLLRIVEFNHPAIRFNGKYKDHMFKFKVLYHCFEIFWQGSESAIIISL
jgi:hypothetical protein